jgi:hypothetical protein
MVRVVHPDFLPIPDPGIKKAPDPESGSAKLHYCRKKIGWKFSFPISQRRRKHANHFVGGEWNKKTNYVGSWKGKCEKENGGGGRWVLKGLGDVTRLIET